MPTEFEYEEPANTPSATRLERKRSKLYSATDAELRDYIENATNAQLRQLIYILAMEFRDDPGRQR